MNFFTLMYNKGMASPRVSSDSCWISRIENKSCFGYSRNSKAFLKPFTIIYSEYNFTCFSFFLLQILSFDVKNNWIEFLTYIFKELNFHFCIFYCIRESFDIRAFNTSSWLLNNVWESQRTLTSSRGYFVVKTRV